ncbi:MAG: 50S ribosomal protein L6 [Candidatus Eremiobacterota bacterium]
MSRIGRLPISLPQGVEVKVEDGRVRVKGKKGELSQPIDATVEVAVEAGKVLVRRKNDERRARAQHGLTRTLIQNMVTGVSEGFTRSLDIVGVGYRAQMQGQALQLSMGFSHPVVVEPIEGITFEVEADARAKINRVHVKGIDRQKVGQVAADLRNIRPPEPYKGKGIRYLNETLLRKMGKAGKAGK